MERVAKQWRLKPLPDQDKVKNLQSAINASERLATLLVQRGVEDFDTARNFFNPNAKLLHDPFLMKDMDKAVKRISAALEQGEHIMIYGDYDVDGTTSVALMYSYLRSYENQVSYYIPDRYKEGYGISIDGIDFAVDNEISLIIALDCGIKAIEQVDYATKHGIDFIICDHHLPGATLPKAHAILNPLQQGCDYPCKYLSGCGIGFKLTQALNYAWDKDSSEPLALLDLVAIAAACDIVPIINENRILVHLGLQLMQSAQRPGIKLLLENAGKLEDDQLKRPLNVSDIVFAIGPRINAAGRMDQGITAVELLCAQTLKAAESAAKSIAQSNKDRREVDMQILEESLTMLDFNPEKYSTVVFDSSWHKGVVGIVASRLQDFCYRPTIVLTESNGLISGSARSVHEFDVHAAIASCSDLLLNYGGHRAAAGLTLKPENLDAFKAAFEASVAQHITDDQRKPLLDIDIELNLRDITPKFFETMSRMAPFGPENMRPVFITHNLVNANGTRGVGEYAAHLKLDVTQIGDQKSRIAGIAFNLGDHAERIQTGESFSAVYTLELNEFRGVKSIEMNVKDLRFTDS